MFEPEPAVAVNAGQDAADLGEDEVDVEAGLDLSIGFFAQCFAGAAPAGLIHEDDFAAMADLRDAVFEQHLYGAEADAALLAAGPGVVGQADPLTCGRVVATGLADGLVIEGLVIEGLGRSVEHGSLRIRVYEGLPL